MTLAAKVEQSICNIIEGLNITLNVMNFGNTEELKGPVCAVVCQSITEEAPQLGVWHCMVNVRVEYPAPDTNYETFDTAVDTIFASLLDGSNDLSSSELGLTVMAVYGNAQLEEISGDYWAKSLDLEVIATNGSN